MKKPKKLRAIQLSSLGLCNKRVPTVELVSIGKSIEEDYKEEAKERMAEGGRSGNLPDPEKGQTRDKVAKLIGACGKYITEQAALRYSNSRTSFKVIYSV